LLSILELVRIAYRFQIFGAGASGAYKAKNSSENPKIYVPDWAFSKDSL